jgi:ubiquinone/menaquinone biosynthesis C-methylase UbiE
MTSANAEAIQAWDTILFDKFCLFRKILTTGLGAHGDAILERAPLREGSRVLDVGCGFGDTTIAMARMVGPGGEAVGVDAAPRFVAAAEREAKEAAVANARFFVADVQGDDLRGPYDRVFARFGTMFFASPVAALRNMRRAMRPGSDLTMTVWRKKDDNPCICMAEATVLELLPQHEKGDQVTCGPGPFSMASADVVSAQLLAAGFTRPCFERFDVEIYIGANVAEAIDFALTLGPAVEVVRLAGEEAERKRPEITARLTKLFAPFERADGVWGGSSSWLVTARA